MTDQELMDRLKSAVEHAAPDDLEVVLSRCGSGKGTVIDMKKASSTPTGGKRRYRGLIAACLALVLLAGAGGGVFYQRAYAVTSVISLDVNPSIELTVNRNEKVLSCTGLNEEGVAVLAGMNGGKDLEGAKLDVAVNAIVGALVRSGYLDDLDSAILISVEDSDAARGARLQQELVASVDGVLQTAANQASVLSQSVAADKALESRARENSISTGKASLVEQVIAVNPDLSFDGLAALSVEELRDLIKIGAPDMPIGRDAALQAALGYAGLTESDYTYADVDPELDERVPYYEVELLVGGREYDYGVQAFSGEVIQGMDIPELLAPGPAVTQDAADQAKPAAGAAAQSALIDRESAVDAALTWAGLRREDVGTNGFTGYHVDEELDEARPHYQVEMHINGHEYEYLVDAATGEVFSEPEQPRFGPTVASADAAQIALNHAGVDKTAAECFTKAELDDDQPHYEVTFYADGSEYKYEIDAYTGEILSEKAETLSAGGSGLNDIGEDGAKAAALAHAGLSEGQVSGLRCEGDLEGGRLEYEVEFRADGYEYEYAIDGASGAVLEHERERGD